MNQVILDLGRGLIKVLISLSVGTGVGLLIFGIEVKDKPQFWNMPYPPGEMFLAIGAGLLSTGALMTVLFLVPRLWKARSAEPVKGVPQGDWHA